MEMSVRDGKLEDIERSESLDAGLRVFVGKQQAGVAFSDLSPAGSDMAVARAVAMAKAAPEDPYAHSPRSSAWRPTLKISLCLTIRPGLRTTWKPVPRPSKRPHARSTACP